MISYSSGEEPLDFFWKRATAPGTDVYHGTTMVITTWLLQDVLDRMKDPHIMMSSRDRSGKIRYVVLELRVSNSNLLKSQVLRQPVLVYLYRQGIHGLIAEIAAATKADLQRSLKQIFKGFPKVPVPEPEPGRVFMTFMHLGNMGPSSRTRSIAAPEWADVMGNYPASVAGRLSDFLAGGPENLIGHLGVLYGPPGTGKTTYLRAMAREWAENARFSYIVDTDRLFGDPGYLTQVILDEDDDYGCNRSSKWHVVICEDAEEFIASGAKAEVGQSLSRVLNLGDGMLGQGLKTLLLFTTNVAMDQLNPAVVRPGRCFLNLEIPSFGATEAAGWLTAHGLSGKDTAVSGTITLAELYARIAKPAVSSKS
jgi:hypothetical protein